MTDDPDVPSITDSNLNAPAFVPEHDDRSSRMTRVVAVITAVLAVAASWLGYLVADSTSEANGAASRSRALAVELQNSNARLNDAALAKVSDLLRRQVALAGLDVVRGARFSAGADGFWRSEDALAGRRLRAAERESGVERRNPGHPDRDSFFPHRLLVDTVDRSTAGFISRQDALAEIADKWHRKRAAYLGALLVIAVGIYLLGFSMTLEGGGRVAVFVVGLGLGVAGLSWGAAGLARVVPAETDRGHAAYEAAVHAYLVATTVDEAARSVAHFDVAIHERPTFARAYIGRADAIADRAELELGVVSELPSVYSSEDRIAMISDQRQAIALGLDSPVDLTVLGFHETIVGLETGNEGLLTSGLVHASAAARALQARVRDSSPSYLMANAAIAHANEGLAHLAAGDDESARAAYLRLAPLVDRLHESAPFLAKEALTGALTDIDLLKSLDALSDEEMRAAKELVVASAVGGDERGSGAILGGTAEVAVDTVRVEGLRRKDASPKTDRLAVLFYRKIAGDWQAVPAISSMRLEWSDLIREKGTWLHHESLLDTCNPAGSYKAEIYLNGRLQRVLYDENVAPALETPTLSRVAMRMCVPESWNRRSPVPGVVEGFVDPESRRGVYVFRVPLVADRSVAAEVDDGVGRVMKALRLRAPLRQYADSDPDFIEWLLYSGGERKYATGPLWTYGGGRAWAEAGVARDRNEIVGVAVFGPGDFVSELGYAYATSARFAP